MKALFLVNERSGARRKFDVAEVIRRAVECSYEIVPCRAKEELPSIIDRAEREGFDVVYAVGGDGTVHETAKHLVGRAPALGILPIGSGNGFARHLGLPMDPAKAIRSCRAGTIVTVDTAEVNGTPFVGVMGVGLDAAIAHRFASSKIRGLKTYIAHGFAAFVQFRAEEYEIVTDSERLHTRALVVVVANSGQYGNNAHIAPLASVRDGLLDLVAIDDTSLLRAPFLMIPLALGTLHRSRAVTSIRTREVTIRRKSEGPAHLDGEPYTLPAELRIRVVPQSLRLLVPDSARRI